MEVRVSHLKCFKPDSCQKLCIKTGQRTMNRLITRQAQRENVKQHLGRLVAETGRVFTVKLCRRVQECEGRSKKSPTLGLCWLCLLSVQRGGRKEATCIAQVAETPEFSPEVNCTHSPGIQMCNFKGRSGFAIY